MHALTRQLKAAQAQYDSMSPPEPDDRDPSDAIDTIATRMAVEFEVGETLEDLYGGGYMAGALRRLMAGRPPLFCDAATLQALLRRVETVESQVETEMNS